MNKFEIALKKYIDIFINQEMYFENDNRHLKLFKEYAANTSAVDIRMKISAINDSTIWQSGLTEDMTAHVLKLNMDSRLQTGDLTVVDDIAQLKARAQSFNLLHFASVYCNLHHPDIFPIYSEQHFDFYRKYIAEHKLPLDPDKLNTYSVFCQALNHLIEQIDMKGKMNYLQFRKFAWLYAESVLKESDSSGE